MFGEYAGEHHLELGHPGVGQSLTLDGAPGQEPFAAGGEGADARLHPVRDHHRLVERKEGRDLHLVGLQLLEGGPDGGVLVGGILEFDHGQRQAVDKEHQVGPTLDLPFDDRELVDRQEFVVCGIFEIDDTDQLMTVRAVPAPDLDGDALHQHAVQGVIVVDQ